MKKILIVSRPFLGKMKGTGEQVVTNQIYKAFLKHNIKPTFCKKIIVPEYGSIFSILFYDYIYVFFLFLKNIFFRSDVILFSSPYQTAFISLFKLFKSKTFVISHDIFYFDKRKKSNFGRYSDLLYKNAFYFADEVITTSQQNKTKMDKIFNVKTKMIPLGIDDNLIYKKGSEGKYKKDFYTVGYIGKYDERKRVDYILNLLNSDLENRISFVFAGDMPDNYLEKVNNEIEKGKNISNLGYIWGKEKVLFYEKISFLYFPTSNEGFGIPILESFQAGVIPIVHSDADIPSDLKENCILVDKPSDVVDIVEKYSKNIGLYENTIKKNRGLLKNYDYDNYVTFLYT